MIQAEPSHTYGSDVNTELRRNLDDLVESTYQARKTMSEGREAAIKMLSVCQGKPALMLPSR